MSVSIRQNKELLCKVRLGQAVLMSSIIAPDGISWESYAISLFGHPVSVQDKARTGYLTQVSARCLRCAHRMP